MRHNGSKRMIQNMSGSHVPLRLILKIIQPFETCIMSTMVTTQVFYHNAQMQVSSTLARVETKTHWPKNCTSSNSRMISQPPLNLPPRGGSRKEPKHSTTFYLDLSKTNTGINKHLLQRAKRPNNQTAPIHRLVDIAKDLHHRIPERIGGHKNTLDELARDIICHAIVQYYFDGIELICLTMDVAAHMTSLRVIPHAKRGKMDKIKMSHGSLARVKQGSDDLTPHGARSDLLNSGDERFTGLLFEIICNQAKALQKGDWMLPPSMHRGERSFVLAVIGGSSQACVAVGVGGKQSIRLNSESIVMSCEQVENEFEKSKIVKSEEGEMMVYAAMRAILRYGFTHNGNKEKIDCIFEIHSDDSDAFAGISMQAIYHLESTCKQGQTFAGAIFLRGPRKSVPQISNLGNIFKTNLVVDRELCPTGRGFHCVLDLIAVYYSLEQDKDLPELPHGHRAISAVAVTYTLSNHDYLSWAACGLTYSKLIKSMKSPAYKKEVDQYARKADVSPISLTPQTVFINQSYNTQGGYNLPGILLLLNHAFINRPLTRKFLLMKDPSTKQSKYTTADLSKGLPFDVVRAAAILAGELHPVPDPISLLSYLSCANIIFRRWTIKVYDSGISTNDELRTSCYRQSEVRGQTEMSVDYDLSTFADTHRQQSLDVPSLARALRTSQYGNILPANMDVFDRVKLPFDPVEEIQMALSHRGYYPSITVSSASLPSLPVPTTAPSVPTPHTTADQSAPATHPPTEPSDSEDDPEELLAQLQDDGEEFVDPDSEYEPSIAGSLSDDESDQEDELGDY